MLKHQIIYGKSEIELKQFDDNTFDSCVTDPPYGLEFMGKDWDKLWAKRDGLTQNLPDRDYGTNPYLQAKVNKYVAGKEAQEWHYQWATELYRVMKPGAHILVFGGTRTYHRMACAVEDAGFEIRDMIEWFYAVGIDSKQEYCQISSARLKNEIEREQTKLTGKLSEITCTGF